MKVLNIFMEKGVKIPVEGNKPHLLDHDGYVWMVENGKISVYSTALTKENKPGAKKFLFEAEKGDLLFGLSPEGTPARCLLASGLVGSNLLRLQLNQLGKHLAEEAFDEVIPLVTRWLKALSTSCTRDEKMPGEEACTKEELVTEHQYINDPVVMKYYHSLVLQSLFELSKIEHLAEKKRLQEKTSCDRRLMANSISRLASINQKEKTIKLDEITGDNLLDACRLVGRATNIEILPPPPNNYGIQGNIQVDDIARASRIRTREVALDEEWYRQDCGPVLGFMEEDNSPVALIPASPGKYLLFNFASGQKVVVNRVNASKIKRFGFVFYRPFENKKIGFKELISFGCKSCWKQDILVIMLMGILGGILGTAIPLATGVIFGSIIPEGDRGQLLQIALFLGASALASMLFQLTRSLAILRMEGKIEGSLQASVWDRLLSLPAPFFKQFSAGELAMRAMGITYIRTILSGATINTILSSLFSVFIFALLFYYDMRLAGIAALLVTFAMVVMVLLGLWQVRYEHKVLEISNNLSGMILQFIEGITRFRAAGAETRAFNQWSKEFEEQRRLTYKRETLGNLLATFNAFFPITTSMIIFYALTSSSSILSPGQFIAFNSALLTFMVSMMSLSESLIRANIVIPLYQKARPILESLPEYDDTKTNPMPLTGSLEVKHVSFRYKEEGPLILQDISFQVDEGDYVALVGPSGCGKSTLLRVLLGFEKPETGRIYYNGQDLSKIDIRAVRKQLGVVLQNGQLMSGNIFTNITGGNPYLTMEDAWEAARMAGIEDDIKEMPMGMHTFISQGASTISGGQKQRLMIARAIVNKPKIIFFDEATSALDNLTQAVISKSLEQLKATRIVIAHRLSTIINCNKIIVMDRGRIVERGTYQDLMDHKGVFADLVKRQLD